MKLALLFALAATPAIAQPCNPGWTSRFPGGDFDGAIRASVVFNDGSGDALYIAGSFSRAGSVHAQGVAKWTGAAWIPVGGDFDSDVNALFVHTDGALYAGGAFSSVSGTSTPRVARWNGNSWTAMGSSPALSGTVAAFASFPDEGGVSRLWITGKSLYASPNSSIAMRWNGTSWSSPSLQDPHEGACFAVYAEQGVPHLFVGQNQSSAVRRWSGSSWQLVGSFPWTNSGTINTMFTFDDGSGSQLYVGGAALFPNSTVIRWNGSGWSNVGANAPFPVKVFAAYDPDGPGPQAARLEAGTSPGAAGSIWAWTGSDWQSSATADGDINALSAFGSSLFAGGYFSSINGVPACAAAILPLTSPWQPMADAFAGRAPSDLVRCMAWFDDDGPGPHPPKLYIGGDFVRIGSLPIRYIAAWDGASWSPLSNDLTSPVLTMKVFDDGNGPALYFGASSPSISASNVLRWNGSTLSPVGTLHPMPVCLEVFQPTGGTPHLFAGGQLSNPSGTGTACILRLDGSTWSTVGTGLSLSSTATMQAFDDGTISKLFIAEPYNILSANRVFAWDGATWVQLTIGNGYLTAFAVHNDGTGNALYGAGAFAGSPGGTVAKWNGSSWTALPGSLGFTPRAATSHNDGTGAALYVGGSAALDISTPSSSLARWKGSAWSAVAPSAQMRGTLRIETLQSADPDGAGPAPADLYVGGFFNTIGGISSDNLAVFSGCACYPNCDQSQVLPLLNINDFQCFLNKFAANDPYANCDGSTTPPTLTAADFQCFLNQFAAGCN